MKRFLTLLLTIFALSSIIVGCSSKTTSTTAPTSPSAKTNTEDFNTELTLNGSSTLAPVVSKVAQDFQAKYGTWDKVDATFPNEKIAINVVSGGSGQGVKSLIEKTADFGMVARSIKDKEKEQLPKLEETQVGIDALTVSVNPNNPVLGIKDTLTKEEIIKLFAGDYKYWSDLDAMLPKEEVVVITRDIGGGAHEVFQSKIMGDTQVKQDAIQAPSMGALVQKITENEYAIGYASYGVVNQNASKIIPLKVDGIDATKENIENGSYIIQRPLILIHNGPKSKQEQYFIDYLKSESGLSVVESLGFIPTK